jgi:hypothetical protein
MSIIHFPKLSNTIWKHIDCVINTDKPGIFISFSLYKYLYEICIRTSRDHLFFLQNTEVNTSVSYSMHSYGINEYRNIASICVYKPVSDLYFKLIETVQSLRFTIKEYIYENFVMFSVGKNPYSAIEPFYHTRKNNKDKYFGIETTNITRHKEENPPGILPFTKIPFTCDDPQFMKYIVEHHKNIANFVVCEGGDDSYPEFIKNEQLFAEIFAALCLQKKGGCLIVKLTDCFQKSSIDIIYILSSMYDKTYISKPMISPQSSSERFLVCTNFTFSDCNDYYKVFEQALEKIRNKKKDETIDSFLSTANIPLFFKTKMEECNVIIGQQQLENIHRTFLHGENIYENMEILNNKKNIMWCDKYNIEHNQKEFENNIKNNIFRQANI